MLLITMLNFLTAFNAVAIKNAFRCPLMIVPPSIGVPAKILNEMSFKIFHGFLFEKSLVHNLKVWYNISFPFLKQFMSIWNLRPITYFFLTARVYCVNSNPFTDTCHLKSAEIKVLGPSYSQEALSEQINRVTNILRCTIQMITIELVGSGLGWEACHCVHLQTAGCSRRECATASQDLSRKVHNAQGEEQTVKLRRSRTGWLLIIRPVCTVTPLKASRPRCASMFAEEVEPFTRERGPASGVTEPAGCGSSCI